MIFGAFYIYFQDIRPFLLRVERQSISLHNVLMLFWAIAEAGQNENIKENAGQVKNNTGTTGIKSSRVLESSAVSNQDVTDSSGGLAKATTSKPRHLPNLSELDGVNLSRKAIHERSDLHIPHLPENDIADENNENEPSIDESPLAKKINASKI